MYECPRRIERYALAIVQMTNAQISDYIDAALDPTTELRREDGTPWPAEDEWRDGTCSYCGSMRPDDLFAAIAVGAEIGPTDKNYKVYVRGGDRITHGGARGTFEGKFYTSHLNRRDATRLRALLDEGRVKVGYPGHFYAGLWLAAPKDPA